MRGLQRTDALLAVGMFLGVALAAGGLVLEQPLRAQELTADVVAIVGEQSIPRSALETAVALVERDRGRPVRPEERTQILERLIDEELLFQQGLALDLPRSDRKLRGDLVSLMIEVATSKVADPTPDELRAFFDSHRTVFLGPPALRMAQVFVSTAGRGDAEAAAMALRARDRLRAGDDVNAVRTELGDPPPLELPAAAIPPSRLRDYVGPAASVVGQSLAVGAVSEPQASPDGYRVLVMLGREEGEGQGQDEVFAAHQSRVLAEYRRRDQEAQLRRYLDAARAQVEVTLAADVATR